MYPLPIGPQQLMLPGKQFTTLNTMYRADAMDLLRNLDDNSVDMVLTDPPYGITQNKWDVMPDLPAWWAQVERVTKPNAAIVITASQPFTSLLVVSNLELFRYEWIWQKTQSSNFLDARRKPLKIHESVIVFSSGMAVYYPQMEKGTAYVTRGTRNKLPSNYGKFVPKGYVNSGHRFPNTLIKIANEKGAHPTQKPVALFEYLIKTYTQPGELVLDPYMGSGTTAVAALKTDRQYIGSELDAGYHAAAVRRVQNVDPTRPTINEDGSKQLSLFAASV